MIAGARRSKVAHDRMGNLLTATLDGGAGDVSLQALYGRQMQLLELGQNLSCDTQTW